MGRIFRLQLIVIYLTIAVVGFGQNLRSASVVKNQSEILQTVQEFLAAHSKLEAYAENPIIYFQRGLGWVSNGGYGFFSGADQVYFNPQQVGFSIKNSAKEDVGGYTIQYSEDLSWATLLDQQGTKMQVGYRGNEPINLIISLKNGGTIVVWDKSVSVKYAQEAIHYRLAYDRSAPRLRLSRQLADAVFGSVMTPESLLIIEDIQSDFPFDYFTRVLSDAINQKISLADEEEAAQFAVNWFRKLTKLDSVRFDPLLDAAAEAHVSYLVKNNVSSAIAKDVEGGAGISSYLSLHDERPGKPGFTGASVVERTQKSGYGRSTGETATLDQVDVISEIIDWFHTVFHRRPFLDPRVVHYAHAREFTRQKERNSVAVGNWGYVFSVDSPEIFQYPAAGEMFVPWAWSGGEAPDPFPDNNGGIGPPITFYRAEDNTNWNLKLISERGEDVPLAISPVAPDRRFVEATPRSPLEPNTMYSIVLNLNGMVRESTFTTAPLHPAETIMKSIKSRLRFDIELRDVPINVDHAMKLNAAPGQLQLVRQGNQRLVKDSKYDFTLKMPEEWSLSERTWQEVYLSQGNSSINIQLYAHGNNPDARPIRSQVEPQLKLIPKSSGDFGTRQVTGYRVEYEWAYAGKTIVYYLIFGDYALIVSGYGVEGPDIDGVVASFEASAF